jgi:hypothetical protein
MLDNRKIFVPVKGQDWGQFNVKFSFRLIKYHAMKTRCGVKVWLHAFLISTLDVSVSVSHSGRITSGETIHSTITQEAG